MAFGCCRVPQISFSSKQEDVCHSRLHDCHKCFLLDTGGEHLGSKNGKISTVTPVSGSLNKDLKPTSTPMGVQKLGSVP